MVQCSQVIKKEKKKRKDCISQVKRQPKMYVKNNNNYKIRTYDLQLQPLISQKKLL